MSFHNKPDYHIPELIEALKAHRLPHDTPSQLADSFRIGWMACRELAQDTAAPAGDWLWVKLMDFCKKRGFAPANFNDLFEIVDAARAARTPVDSVLEDAARLDWLEQNLFHREKDEWDTKFGGYKEYNMWVLFSPKGIQGRARDIIDAARKQGVSQ